MTAEVFLYILDYLKHNGTSIPSWYTYFGIHSYVDSMTSIDTLWYFLSQGKKKEAGSGDGAFILQYYHVNPSHLMHFRKLYLNKN